jgi:hypothetical protein
VAIFDVMVRRLVDLQRVPVASIKALEEVLTMAFDLTQEDVHVITGSLRGSAKSSTSVDDSTWQGEIVYGGSSPGFPKDPVSYAGHERLRGGAHDYFANLVQLYPAFEEAIQMGFR